MSSRVVCVAIAVLIASSASARADLEVRADLDRESVGVGQELVLSVTVTGGFQNLPGPRVPEMEGFTVYPSGSSTSFSFVNGRVFSSKTSRFALVPQKEGTWTIPPITVTHDGVDYTTDPIEITVTAAAQPDPSSPRPGAPAGRPAPSGGDAGLMLRASVDKERAYVNEQVTLTLRFYHRTGLAGSRLIPPVTKGFWVEKLPGEKKYYVVEDGLQYAVTEIAMALFPTTDGTLTIGSATWECAVRERLDVLGGDPFDILRMPRTRNVSVKSDEIEITVLPLPREGRPDEFEGAVGDFTVTSRADKTEVPVEEPISFTVTVSGVGNLNTVGEVAIPEIPGFRGYDSGGTVDLSKDKGVVRGSKSFSRVFVPTVPGEYTIPQVTFAYFNPSEERYVAAASKEIPVKVTAGEGAGAQPSARADFGSPAAKDIRYIKTGVPSFSRLGERLHRRSSFLLLQCMAPLMVILAYAYRAARERSGADPERGRARKAKGAAMKTIARARSQARSGAVEETWKTLAHALRGYVADVTGASARGMTLEDLRIGLSRLGVEEGLVQETADLLDRCDATAYAPGGAAGSGPEETFRVIEDLVKRLDRSRRKR